MLIDQEKWQEGKKEDIAKQLAFYRQHQGAGAVFCCFYSSNLSI